MVLVVRGWFWSFGGLVSVLTEELAAARYWRGRESFPLQSLVGAGSHRAEHLSRRRPTGRRVRERSLPAPRSERPGLTIEGGPQRRYSASSPESARTGSTNRLHEQAASVVRERNRQEGGGCRACAELWPPQWRDGRGQVCGQVRTEDRGT